MVMLAFIMTHLISYQKLPFSNTYQFPFIPFSIFIIYGIFICEVNSWNFKQLASRYRLRFDLKSIRRIVQANLIACTIIFTLLTVIQMLIFHYVMNPFRFVGLLSVCLMISMIETGVFIVLEFVRQKHKSITLNQVAAERNKLTIVQSNELMTFSEEEVAYLIHRNGCVFLVDQAGHRYITQFESLSEVEPRLSSRFFRVNRQTIVSKTAINSLKKDVNNKLKLQVNHLVESLTVSRYKSKSLKQWYKN